MGHKEREPNPLQHEYQRFIEQIQQFTTTTESGVLVPISPAELDHQNFLGYRLADVLNRAFQNVTVDDEKFTLTNLFDLFKRDSSLLEMFTKGSNAETLEPDQEAKLLSLLGFPQSDKRDGELNIYYWRLLDPHLNASTVGHVHARRMFGDKVYAQQLERVLVDQYTKTTDAALLPSGTFNDVSRDEVLTWTFGEYVTTGIRKMVVDVIEKREPNFTIRSYPDSQALSSAMNFDLMMYLAGWYTRTRSSVSMRASALFGENPHQTDDYKLLIEAFYLKTTKHRRKMDAMGTVLTSIFHNNPPQALEKLIFLWAENYLEKGPKGIPVNVKHKFGITHQYVKTVAEQIEQQKKWDMLQRKPLSEEKLTSRSEKNARAATEKRTQNEADARTLYYLLSQTYPEIFSRWETDTDWKATLLFRPTVANELAYSYDLGLVQLENGQIVLEQEGIIPTWQSNRIAPKVLIGLLQRESPMYEVNMVIDGHLSQATLLEWIMENHPEAGSDFDIFFRPTQRNVDDTVLFYRVRVREGELVTRKDTVYANFGNKTMRKELVAAHMIFSNELGLYDVTIEVPNEKK